MGNKLQLGRPGGPVGSMSVTQYKIKSNVHKGLLRIVDPVQHLWKELEMIGSYEDEWTSGCQHLRIYCHLQVKKKKERHHVSILMYSYDFYCLY